MKILCKFLQLEIYFVSAFLKVVLMFFSPEDIVMTFYKIIVFFDFHHELKSLYQMPFPVIEGNKFKTI